MAAQQQQQQQQRRKERAIVPGRWSHYHRRRAWMRAWLQRQHDSALRSQRGIQCEVSLRSHPQCRFRAASTLGCCCCCWLRRKVVESLFVVAGVVVTAAAADSAAERRESSGLAKKDSQLMMAPTWMGESHLQPQRQQLAPEEECACPPRRHLRRARPSSSLARQTRREAETRDGGTLRQGTHRSDGAARKEQRQTVRHLARCLLQAAA